MLLIYQNTNEPIYKQIAKQIKEEILQGKLQDGDLLPSIRNLAKELRISVITTTKAYEELESQRLIQAVPGKGYYVHQSNKEFLQEQYLQKIEELLMEALECGKSAGITPTEIGKMLEVLITEKHN